jgi:secreted Zn-dependent insulinase-like peptidase
MDDPKKFGEGLAKANEPDMTNNARSSACIELISDIYKLLIEKQILTQGDAVARLEKVSNAVMASDTGTSRAHAVTLIDIVRDGVAGERERKPS